MTQKAAALQAYNDQVFKCVEELYSKRKELKKLKELKRQIRQEKEENERLQHDLLILSEKLCTVNESLSQRLPVLATFDCTIAETEDA